MRSYSESYKSAGVDIEAGYESVRLIKDHVKKTFTKGVLGDIGSFGGLFELGSEFHNPVLVSGTDGVGTKLKLAFIMDKHNTIGQDCVAMCVNDIVCAGARPLIFLDYLALGHVHSCTGVVRAGRVAYGYCGCPEGRGFDELGDKGFLYGDIGPGTAELRFVAFARRRYRIWEADVTDGDPLAAVERLLPQDTAEDICRLRLVGTPEEPVRLPLLQQSLEGRFFALQLRDETTVRREIWDKCGEDTLRGLFLQELRREYDGGDDETRRRIELAARFGVAAMDNREV